MYLNLLKNLNVMANSHGVRCIRDIAQTERPTITETNAQKMALN